MYQSIIYSILNTETKLKKYTTQYALTFANHDFVAVKVNYSQAFKNVLCIFCDN